MLARNTSPVLDVSRPGQTRRTVQLDAPRNATTESSGSRRSWSSLFRRGIAIAGVAALTVWIASWRVSAGPAAGTALLGETAVPSAARRTLRVATFNIHRGKGLDGSVDLARTARTISDFDLVALNEVDGRFGLTSSNQAQSLGELNDCRWLFAPAERRWWHTEFGSGLLSRFDAGYWQRIPLERDGARSCRNVLLTAIDCAGTRVHVVVTHLDSRDAARRQRQLRAVGELFLSLREPALLMGDLNTASADPELARLLSAPGVVDPLAAVGATPDPGRIDWILARGLKPVTGAVRDTAASDHPCVWAEFALPSREAGAP